jgi:hypothetical protein
MFAQHISAEWFNLTKGDGAKSRTLQTKGEAADTRE